VNFYNNTHRIHVMIWRLHLSKLDQRYSYMHIRKLRKITGKIILLTVG